MPKKPTKIKYRSNFESLVHASLKGKNSKVTYETHKFKYTVERTYTVDFTLHGKKLIFIESKGRFTSADRTKLLTIKKQYPNIDIRLLFQQDNWLTKQKKQRYSDWASKNGFKYSIWPRLPI